MKRNKCDYCGTVKPDLKKADGWVMQYLHVNIHDPEETEDFLTCDKCKHLNPFKFLDKLTSKANGK